MPTYEYACTECGDRLDVVQSFSDDPLTVCGACGGKLRKVFSPVGIVFKGSGFYRTDSRTGAVSAGANGKGSADGAGSDGGSADSGGKTDSGAKAESGKKADSGSPAGSNGNSSSNGSAAGEKSKKDSSGSGSSKTGTSSKVA